MKNILYLSLFLLFFVSAGQVADAKSVSNNQQINYTYYYYTHPDQPMVGLRDPNVTVSYSAYLTDLGGVTIPDGSNVPVGSQVKITPKAHESSDIYWFGTGASNDSPYGDWGSDVGSQFSCLQKDYVDTVAWHDPWTQACANRLTQPIGEPGPEDSVKCDYLFNIYAPLYITQPARSITTSSNLSCGAPAGDGSRTCTVTSPGAASATVSFGATTGKFYYRYEVPPEEADPSGQNWQAGCYGNNYPMGSSNYYDGPTLVQVPAQSISFSFTAFQPNQPPATPSITCPSGGQVGQTLSFSVSGTDPDGDQIHFGLDWTANGVISQWVPASGYVPSGSTQSFSRSWSSSGTYSVRAITQDTTGTYSGWSGFCSVTITDPPPTALLTATPASVAYGAASTLQWSSANATSCTGTGFNTGGATSGSVSTGALSSNQSYSVSCTGPGGSASSNASVTVGPAPQPDLTAGVTAVSGTTAGSPSTFTATASNTGAGSSGAFPMLFQVLENGALMNSSYVSGLAPNTSQSMNASYTFPSAGTYNVRACANYNTSWTAITSESDYSNNCGPWTTVTINPSGPPPPLSCTANTTTIPVGGSVTFTASGASSPLIWTPSETGGGYMGGLSTFRTYNTAGSYGMTVSKAGYTSGTCPIITVGTPSCGTASVGISANPDRVREGNTTTLTWYAANVDSSCTISGPGVNQTVAAGGTCDIPPGTATPTITSQSVYTISCDNGESTAQVIVNIIPKFIEF